MTPRRDNFPQPQRRSRRVRLQVTNPDAAGIDEVRWVLSTLRVNHDFNVHVAADTTNVHGTLAWAIAKAENGDTILLIGDAATGLLH